MSQFNCEIIPPKDLLVLQSFKKLYEDFSLIPNIGPLAVTVNLGLLPGKQIDINQYFDSEEFKTLSELNIDMIYHMALNITNGGSSVTFRRDGSKPTATLAFNGNTQTNTLEWNNALFGFRKILSPGSAVSNNLFDREIIASINRDLASVSSHLKEDINKRIRESELELKKIKKDLNSEYELKVEVLSKKHIDKEEELRKREEELERISNTDARRKIRLDLNKEIDQKIESFGPSKLISDDFKGLNRVFISILSMLITVAAYFIGVIFYKLLRGESQVELLSYLGIEFGISVIGTVGFFIYYSRWKSNWLNKLLHEEFSLKKYRLDMDRSSWVLESYLEMQMAHQKELPESLLGAITTNLFQNSVEEVATSKHPVEDILNGLTKNSRIKVKSGKHELELNKGEV